MDSDINYIIQKSLNGDKNYQEILLKNLNPLLYKNIYMYWNFGDSITEDLVQEGYAIILQAIKTFDKDKNVHFLHYVKSNIEYFYKNYYRKNIKLRNEISLSKDFGQTGLNLSEIADRSFNALENIILKEGSKELWLNIKKLNPIEQEIIVRYYFSNQLLTEISKSLNIPYRTVIGKKKTALIKLKKFFQEVR